ncbi:MAG TPA: hypothetical protein VKE22_00990 [Haliangiales bacterium]|nr:hypothetical protein [Haliangiales bacterium]
MLTEKEGRAVLRARFEAAGLTIEEDFALDDPPITLDGWDATRRVGYEFLTTEAGDRDEITWQALEALELRMGFGEIHVLLIDEKDVSTAEQLGRAADYFLAEVRKLGRIP